MELLIVFLLIVLVVGASALYIWYQEKKDDERYAREMKRRETELIGSLHSPGVNRIFYPTTHPELANALRAKRKQDSMLSKRSFVADTGSDIALSQTSGLFDDVLNSFSYSDCAPSSESSPSSSDSSSSLCD